MVIHKIAYHQRDGSAWVSMPSEKYTKPGGETAYSALIEFSTAEAKKKFQELATQAIARYLKSAGEDLR